ncbi:helix-turn-helix transcriptional regulator [Streptomyces genisteinicus]|uniref:AraC family transcriptional regulator n=1 Tax=Streptomyces genisteinicus TaxID=2768068 RepID=A0A7H0HVX7_9ACTN|nr:AraC family transcriptional regulator [Streptomyces genisteinicus]QNP64693.1 AraC family transcriptional regulator [Streptomyces genisteinicus]
MRGTTVTPGATTPPRTPDDGALPMHRLEVPMPNAMPFAIGTFDTIGPMSRADFPHRHTFWEIVHVTGGTGAHVVDLARWELDPPHLCVIAPGQVHHWEDARGLDGTVVLFTDGFLRDHPGDRELLRGLGARPWLALDEARHSAVARLVAELGDEYRRGARGFDSVLRALLHVLVVRASRMQEDPARTPGARSARAGDGGQGRPGAVAAEFVRLIGGSDPALWSVGVCAARIGVTPGYLAEAVKTATGRTPGELVRAARTHEAQRLLARTGLSVRQVAGRVGFADPAYFCRFFRRETGTSPGDFRRGAAAAGEIHHEHRIQSIARPEPGA